MLIANVVADGGKAYGARLLDWLERRRPDVVALQKIGANFPASDALREVGYESRNLTGPRPELGVAVLSPLDLPPPSPHDHRLPGARRDGARFIGPHIGGLRVASVYAPYNPKSLGKAGAIAHRVASLNRRRDRLLDEGWHRGKAVLGDDFNVKFAADGPRERLYSQREEGALGELMAKLGLRDLYREAHPDPEKERGRTRGYSEQSPEGSS